MKYHVEVRVSPPQLGRSIIDSARDAISGDHWAKLIKAKPVVAAAKAVKSLGYSNTPKFDHAVTKLLNVISRSYVQVVQGPAVATTPAVVFSGPDTREIVGDYLAACSKPDTTCFMATWALLQKALKATQSKPFVSRQEFMDLLGVGEWKPKEKLDIRGQLLWYLAALKRYRPDLFTVYGLFIVKDTLRLLSHNACGTIESHSEDLDHVETWVAFVVLLYRSHQSRDVRFSPVPRPDRHALWSVQTAPGVSSIFRPFHAGHSPGRVTWLSFEQDPASPELACGFLKVSWQDASSNFNEPALLERAHKGGWLPGLVRHRFAQRSPSKSVSLAGSTRVQEIVHLASIGSPLSQCRSALHLFKVVFDAIGVHENLLGEDILHRDLSWFNLLCDPRHDPSTDGRPIKLGVPTIEYILTDKESEPCALVLDLDHGAVMTELHSAAYKPRKGKSGTPMFAAVELSSEDPVKTTGFSPSLLKRLEAFDKLPEELRKRAYPNDDGTFMKVFNEIYDLEDSRSSVRHKHYGATTDPSSLHRPRHDMESLFWILLWALLRASPLFGTPAGLTNDLALSETANILLNHRIGTKEEVRSGYRRDPPVSGLHPLFKSFGELLIDMATYLRIPWHLYEGTVEGLSPKHVHIAFRRMLLVQIYELSLNNAAKDVLFNRKMPRNIRNESNFGQDRGETPTRSTGTFYPPYPLPAPDSSSASQNAVLRLRSGEGLVRPTSHRETASQRGSKRSAADRDPEDVDEPQPSSKRSKPAQGPTTAESVEQPAAVQQAAADSQPDPAAKSQDDKARSIEKLVNAFWDDRILWFGVGSHRPHKANEMLAGTPAQTDASSAAQSVDVLNSEVDDEATQTDDTDDDAAEAEDSDNGRSA